MSARVLLHWRADGSFGWFATEGVEVVCVDDNAPGDRVYVTGGKAEAAEFEDITDKAIKGEAYQ